MAKKKTTRTTAAGDDGGPVKASIGKPIGTDSAAVLKTGLRAKDTEEQPEIVDTRHLTPTTGPFAVPADADLSYISPELRYLAKPLALFQLEPINVKVHDESDLPAHQQSLRDFGIRRVLIARGANRMLEAGNGAAQAIQRNGWLYAPIALEDDTEQKAKAFGLADNAVGALASWDEVHLKQIRADIEGFELELDLDGLTEKFLAELGGLDSSTVADATSAETDGEDETDAGSVGHEQEQGQYLHRLQVVCKDEPDMLKLQTRLEKQGYTVKIMPTKVV